MCLTKTELPQLRPSPSLKQGCAPSPLYVGLPVPVGIYYQRFPAPLSPTPPPNNPTKEKLLIHVLI